MHSRHLEVLLVIMLNLGEFSNKKLTNLINGHVILTPLLAHSGVLAVVVVGCDYCR